MKTFLLALLMLAMLAGAALFGLWFAVGVPTDGVQLIINDHAVDLHALNGWHAAAGGLATLFALLVVAVVVPLALLFAVALPLLLVLGAVALVLGAALGIGTLAMAPLLLPLMLLWWLWQRSRRNAMRAAPGGGTTIDA
jgi:hypothetical protein